MLISEVLKIMNEKAPLSLSAAACSALGMYDNSGLILEGSATETEGVIFALDLNKSVVELAIKSGYKLIITHHPAIYRPIKGVMQGVYTACLENGITVYSSHLSLDTAVGGIDDGLAKICGANDARVLESTTEGYGFGRAFDVEEGTFGEKVERITKLLGTTKYLAFGDVNARINRIATFCGAGLGEGGIGLARDCDMFVSADIPHHVLLASMERGKCVLQLTHYASEALAMREFAQKMCNENNIKYDFYFDKRFI